MTLPVTPPVFPLAPVAYDRALMDAYGRELQQWARRMNTPGPLVATTIQLTNLPTSSAGLAPGSVWVDAGAGNVLRVV